MSQGWEKRFVADEPRLSEMKELYESIGFEVPPRAASVKGTAVDLRREWVYCVSGHGSGKVSDDLHEGEANPYPFLNRSFQSRSASSLADSFLPSSLNWKKSQ